MKNIINIGLAMVLAALLTSCSKEKDLLPQVKLTISIKGEHTGELKVANEVVSLSGNETLLEKRVEAGQRVFISIYRNKNAESVDYSLAIDDVVVDKLNLKGNNTGYEIDFIANPTIPERPWTLEPKQNIKLNIKK